MLVLGLLSATGVAASSHAATLFSFKAAPLEQKSAAVAERGMHPIELDATLASMQAGERVQMPLPDGSTREVVIDNTFTHPNGDRTWAGYLAAEGTKYRVLITAGRTATVGRILTPDREYGITSVDGSALLVDYTEADVRTFITDTDDVLVPPRPAATVAPPAGSTLQLKATGPSTIDVLVLYSTTYANANGGDANAVTRINSRIALSNQAYIDSGVQLQLRLVGTQSVNYPDSTPIEQTLRELSAVGTTRAAAFAQVPTLRNNVGADLVSLVRTFNGDTAQRRRIRSSTTAATAVRNATTTRSRTSSATTWAACMIARLSSPIAARFPTAPTRTRSGSAWRAASPRSWRTARASPTHRALAASPTPTSRAAHRSAAPCRKCRRPPTTRSRSTTRAPRSPTSARPSSPATRSSSSTTRRSTTTS